LLLTYGFGFLVGGSEFLTLVLKAADLELVLVETTSQLADGVLRLTEVICGGENFV
jgi:hypothetical protein